MSSFFDAGEMYPDVVLLDDGLLEGMLACSALWIG
jgi:hypothetical protein